MECFIQFFSIRYPQMERTENINFSIPILDSIKNVKIKLVPTQILTLMNVQKREYYVIAIKQLVIDHLTIIVGGGRFIVKL